MAMRDMMKWGKKNLPAKREEEGDPFYALQKEINRVFENFSRGFMQMSPFSTSEPLARENWGEFSPQIDVTESDRDFRIAAELPGMDEKDVQVSISKEGLTIRGEKKTEHEEKDENYYRMERSYGSFQRNVPLPEGVDASRADATFKKGVLTITMPKTAVSSSEVKKIPIKKE